jgi:hypothetical protein
MLAHRLLRGLRQCLQSSRTVAAAIAAALWRSYLGFDRITPWKTSLPRLSLASSRRSGTMPFFARTTSPIQAATRAMRNACSAGSREGGGGHPHSRRGGKARDAREGFRRIGRCCRVSLAETGAWMMLERAWRAGRGSRSATNPRDRTARGGDEIRRSGDVVSVLSRISATTSSRACSISRVRIEDG